MPEAIALPSLSRRTVAAALVALPAVWTGARAQAPAPRRATPSQTEGPYYPVALPKDSDADLNWILERYEITELKYMTAKQFAECKTGLTARLQNMKKAAAQ